MDVICIFNPEHDLCLANGNSNYMPPESALKFARESAGLMQILYPEATLCLPSPLALDSSRQFSSSANQHIIPWGWNMVLRNHLLKQGVPESCMPSVAALDAIRKLQHRSTLLPLQPQTIAATTREEVDEMIARHNAVVMKAPWSGSGRGLRWVTGEMSAHDISWMQKVVRNQDCVMVEPRRTVLHDFALEYMSDGSDLCFEGYSLFESLNGVYRRNLLVSDAEVQKVVSFPDDQRQQLESWLLQHIVPQYRGPLGVDILHTPEGCFVSEINLRHTMGLLACRKRG